jgi:phosphatidylserine/phosphatidylglycerophosphate/cardiolipin synthase-like enzyme
MEMMIMKKLLVMLVAFWVLLAACNVPPAPVNADVTKPVEESTEAPVTEAPFTEAPGTLMEIPLGAGYGARDSWYELYFTDPASPLAAQITGGPDGPLAAAIDSARLSVDLAVYSLSLNSIRDALINAHRRGVRVRVVMESDNLDRSDPQKIKEAGVPIIGDRREGLMHNKFVGIDGVEVWLGAMNFTDSGAYKDNNNLMRIRSKEMAENYAKEFDEMFVGDKFGEDVVKETPHPRVIIEDTPIDVYFSPDDGVQASLLELLENAEKNISFMAFSFTADEVGNVMRARAKEGVEVQGVMEEEQVKSNIGTEFDAFKQAGLDVRIDGNEGQMHHKVIIIDASIVVTGSYNFTKSAETRNDENLLVIYNEDIAALFMQEFYRVYGQTPETVTQK